MSDELEQEQLYVEILLDDGSSAKCEIYDVVDFENKTYVLLFPLDDEDGEVFVMEYVEEGDEGYIQNIENEEEFNRVCEYLKSLADEE